MSGAEMRAFLARKAERQAKENQEKLTRARADAETIIQFIIQKYNPTRIYQWGSVLHGSHFTERSDIDIAVEGLSHPFDLHRIIDFAESVTTMPVDIVPIEEIAPEYADSIRSRGKLVYERAES